MDIAKFKKDIFGITKADFEAQALTVFRFQAEANPVYSAFLHHLDISANSISRIEEIPFLPIELFKSKQISSVPNLPAHYFESSGTTSETRSRHYVNDLVLYENVILNTFKIFYGDPAQYCFLFLLPSYLERKNASLVYMSNILLKSGKEGSGFYLDEFEELKKILLSNELNQIKTILLGVSFALLDFSEIIALDLKNTIIIETGGMKGRREEITRAELHDKLNKNFNTKNIHSEYGMTELLSMAYSNGNGKFNSPPWMKILIRDPEDPFKILEDGKSGCMNIIDLANIESCSFIATQDVGKINADNSFEVLGRYDHSDVRGCNLMVD
jgi:hypothetical protein